MSVCGRPTASCSLSLQPLVCRSHRRPPSRFILRRKTGRALCACAAQLRRDARDCGNRGTACACRPLGRQSNRVLCPGRGTAGQGGGRRQPPRKSHIRPLKARMTVLAREIVGGRVKWRLKLADQYVPARPVVGPDGTIYAIGNLVMSMPPIPMEVCAGFFHRGRCLWGYGDIA